MLSIIVPTYNRSSELRRALTSIYRQDESGFGDAAEIIVVDDGSSDDTQQMVNSNFPRLTYLHQANRGVSAARNVGLAVAKGEWIAFLDSDDEWLQHKLATQFNLLVETGLKLCHTEEIWIRDGVRVNQMNKHKKQGGWIFERCLPLCAMSPSSVVIHREVFDEVGEFDESLPACEDYDLWLRITSKYEVAYVEQACVNKYGGHADQLSRHYWGMDRFRVIALQKFIRQNSAQHLDHAMIHAAKVMLKKKLNILLKGAIKHSNTALILDCERDLMEF